MLLSSLSLSEAGEWSSGMIDLLRIEIQDYAENEQGLDSRTNLFAKSRLALYMTLATI
jgi:hypothetical protein